MVANVIFNGDLGYVIASIVTGVFGVYLARQSKRIHKEVRTNHGQRAGERIERLNEDVEVIKRLMVTKFDLADHAEHDIEVASQIHQDAKRAQKYNEETRAILLAAISRGNHEKD